MAATESGAELAVAGEGLIAVEGEELIAIMQVSLQFFTLLAVVVGALIAYKGLKSNHDWNRRQLALTECLRVRDKITDAQKVLRDNNFHYVERDKGDAYSRDDIHGFLGDRDSNGKFTMSDEGLKIKHNILELLNSYEYLSTGVNQAIFDEQTVQKLTGGALINAYNLFKSYIIHLREDHYKRNSLYSNLELLAKKWESENLSYDKRKKTDD